MSFTKFFRFIFGRRRSSKCGQPTAKQIDYVEKLIEINNTFRSTPMKLDDWIESRCRGKWTFYSARSLISTLIYENSKKRTTFKEKISERNDRQDKETIYASDFSSYGFCPNSFYLSYRGYASRNLYDLEEGQYYHGEYADEDGQSSQNSQMLKESFREIKDVVWFKRGDAGTVYDSELKLAGIPDGLIAFENQKFSIVEIKSTRASNLKTPFWGHIMQACAYLQIYKTSQKVDPAQMSSRMFIIYVNRENKGRTIFEKDFGEYQRSFFSTLKKMREIEFVPELLDSEKNQKKCPKCGYRVLCRKIAG